MTPSNHEKGLEWKEPGQGTHQLVGLARLPVGLRGHDLVRHGEVGQEQVESAARVEAEIREHDVPSRVVLQRAESTKEMGKALAN